MTVDTKWGVWIGGECGNGMVMLASVVTGYHTNTKYQWNSISKEGEKPKQLNGEIFPVLIIEAKRGEYSCTCCVLGKFSIEVFFAVREGIIASVAR